LKYHTTNIKQAITKKLDVSTEQKIVQTINSWIEYHIAYPKNTIKDKIQEIYDFLEIKRAAKAIDLSEWYEIKETTKYINGKNTACIMIIRDKFVLI
jgi:hypothetical protein